MASDAKPPPILFNEAQLRHAVLDTMSRREKSWDPTDGGEYTLDEGAAAIAACKAAGLPHTLAPFLAYSLHWWNDVYAWALGELDGTGAFVDPDDALNGE